MSTNNFQFHVLVLPEDDAVRQIVNGFLLHPNVKDHLIQVMKELGGWEKVVEKFNKNYAADMQNKFSERRVVLVIDFDNWENRLDRVKNQISEDLSNRVFVLGVRSNPQSLRRALNKKKTLEGIGEALAQDCADNQQTFWNHELLRHNQAELTGLSSLVKPFLFQKYPIWVD